MMLSNCRAMPVQFRLTSAMSNSVTPGVATDHQSPKRGEMQVRQNPLRPSLLAQSSMGKQLNPRNCRKLASGHHGKQGATAKKAQDREPGSGHETWVASHRNPVDSGTLQMTTNGSMEQGNPPRLSPPQGEQVSTGCLGGRRFFKKPTPQGKPEDMLT